MKNIGLVPRNRLKNMPEKIRAKHELCFFLHDQCARALVEYESAGAHIETIQFKNQEDFTRFEKLSSDTDVIGALRNLGYHRASKNVVLNTISMAIISDCLHHLYEALRCFEKRKYIVGLNLLRKPLKESLLYLAWLHGRRDEFYDQFTKGDSKYLSQSTIGEKRKEIYSDAIENIEYGELFDPEFIEYTIYNKKNGNGFELFFQHAVHLITIKHQELKTSAENFNFIFKNPLDDDVYDLIYQNLPYLLLFMSHVTIGIFDRMKKMDKTSKHLFQIRTKFSYDLITGSDKHRALSTFRELVSMSLNCSWCSSKCKSTLYNAVRMLLVSEFRCTSCRKISPFLLFSYPEYIE